ADVAARAHDAGHDLHPRPPHRRRDHHPRHRRRHAAEDRRLRRAGARHGKRRRRLVRHRPDARDVQAPSRAAPRGATEAVISDGNVIGRLYLTPIVRFILALRSLSPPKHARRGNWVGGVGMLIAIATSLSLDSIGNWVLIVVGGAIGAVVGVVGARKVKMTAMPQMVALFNGVGGGAAALV